MWAVQRVEIGNVKKVYDIIFSTIFRRVLLREILYDGNNFDRRKL